MSLPSRTAPSSDPKARNAGRPRVGAQDLQHLLDLVEVAVDGRAVAGGERAVEPAPLGEGDGASRRVDDVDPVRPRPELDVGDAEAVPGDVGAQLDRGPALQLPPDRLRPRGPAHRGPVGREVVGGQRPDPPAVEEHVEDLAVLGAEREAPVVHRERRRRRGPAACSWRRDLRRHGEVLSRRAGTEEEGVVDQGDASRVAAWRVEATREVGEAEPARRPSACVPQPGRP